MTAMTHNRLRETIKTRIITGEWKPGSLIPPENAIAKEYQCSRTTVNRALQALADSGLLERRRGSGTRVKPMLVRQAHFDISIIRREIENTGANYRHRLLTREIQSAPDYVQNRLNLYAGQDALHLQTLHLADGRPYAYEDRWVNITAAPEILGAPLNDINANEWLIQEIPFTDGTLSFSAVNIDANIAKAMEAQHGDALMCIERTTWLGDQYITTVKIYYKPGYELKTGI